MKKYGILGRKSELDMRVLHYVVLPRIRKSTDELILQWNYHGMGTAEQSSPVALWNYGMLTQNTNAYTDIVEEFENYGVDYEIIRECADEEDGICVPVKQVGLTEKEQIELKEQFDPLSDDRDSGIQHFLNVRSYILNNFNN